MTTLLSFLPRAQALEASPEVEALVADLLGQLLLVEGPPVDPVSGISEDFREVIARSPKGRPMCLCRTWTTGPWRCLLLDTKSVPMGRPIFLSNKAGGGPPRAITDSPSQAFQRRIVAACRDLGIAMPVGEGAVHTVLGIHRTFLAWRSRELDEPMNRELRGDADNFAKNILDGLQQAGVLPNDRGVFRLTAAKDLPASWEALPFSLEEAIRKEALTRRAKGDHLETIRVDMRLAKAHMARIFPDYDPTYSQAVRNADPAADAAAARQAVDLILTKGQAYQDARSVTGASGTALRLALAKALHPRVLEGHTTLQDLSQELQLPTRATSAIFQGDKKAQEALRKAAQRAEKAAKAAHPRRSKAEASQALHNALRAVLADELPAVEAAQLHQVNLGSLRSLLNRTRHGKASSLPKTGDAGDGAPPKAVNAAKLMTLRGVESVLRTQFPEGVERRLLLDHLAALIITPRAARGAKGRLARKLYKILGSLLRKGRLTQREGDLKAAHLEPVDLPLMDRNLEKRLFLALMAEDRNHDGSNSDHLQQARKAFASAASAAAWTHLQIGRALGLSPAKLIGALGER